MKENNHQDFFLKLFRFKFKTHKSENILSDY